MHFGVEGYSNEDNELRLEFAQAIKAVMWRDTSDSFVEPFPLTSVIQHGGNLSTVVNDPSLYDDLRKTLAFSYPQWDKGKNQDFFDAIATHLRSTEQYGTDKVLQKAIQAALFVSSQQQFPVAHAASSQGRTTNQVRTSVITQQTQKNQGCTTPR